MQQEATTMTRINLFRSTRSTSQLDQTSTLIFAGLLITCSLAVGCSSEKPKSVSSTNDSPVVQPTPPMATAPTATPAMPVQQAAVKPVHKKIVHKAPPTLTYADKTTGVSFQYPRQYALKTGDDAAELVSSGPIPMDFVQPGGSGFRLLQREREQGAHCRPMQPVLRSAAGSLRSIGPHGPGNRATLHPAALEAHHRRHGTPVEYH